MNKNRFRFLILLMFSAGIFAAASPGYSAELKGLVPVNWLGGEGDWSLAANWDTGYAPGTDNMAVIYDGDYPTIYSPAAVEIGQLLMGSGDSTLDLESGASLTTSTNCTLGYVSGTSTFRISGEVNCLYLELSTTFWDNPEPPYEHKVGHTIAELNGPSAAVNAYTLSFSKFEWDSGSGSWQRVAGTGVLFINDGTVSASQIVGFVPGSVERIGIDISSQANGTLSLASGQPVSWWQSQGYIFADGGSGVIQTDNVGDRIIVTARAYDPEVDGQHAYNMAWDAGGETQSLQENWNYESNEVPWPGDVFVTTGAAPLGQHPIIDADAQLGAVTIGWQPSGVAADDYLEIAEGVTLDIIGTPDPEDPESQGQGQGNLNLGANGSTPEAPGRGTLIMNGAALYANGIGVGAGSYDNYLYGDGHIQMNAGIINCQVLQLSILDDPGYPPLSHGSIDMNGGTIVVNEIGGLVGLADSNGIVISGDSTIMVAGDIDAEIAAAVTSGKISAEGGVVVHDYDVTNPGMTTVSVQSCGGDIDGDCDVDVDDVKTLAVNWLTGVSAGGSCDGLTGDLNGDCDVNYKDFAEMAANWIN
ncbi:hypothetical protein SMSP2_02615 [Limihaloglobus sulfuriphilus]|uniref:Dockerin domain-containing protein n=1 Tax=Limihaloglobus sulfuriphilus TaxID=1851148 RepID=A0A1Q2MHV2_9BACT|nr:hypothetical protein [Limihaloglobus sulfuriphilus]AQQ72234.1 hypothetical protein SMSP2_02615 [Limihaloglobus sulfuriphilus]